MVRVKVRVHKGLGDECGQWKVLTSVVIQECVCVYWWSLMGRGARSNMLNSNSNRFPLRLGCNGEEDRIRERFVKNVL